MGGTLGTHSLEIAQLAVRPIRLPSPSHMHYLHYPLYNLHGDPPPGFPPVPSHLGLKIHMLREFELPVYPAFVFSAKDVRTGPVALPGQEG